MPQYAMRKHYEADTGWWRYLQRGVLGLVCLKIGYELGKIDSVDEELVQAKVLEFQTEEEIFDQLINKNKMAVFLFLYTPGPNQVDEFNAVFERESSKYRVEYRKKKDPWYEGDESDDIVFMRVHCRKHLNFCVNKMWDKRIQPFAELYTLND